MRALISMDLYNMFTIIRYNINNFIIYTYLKIQKTPQTRSVLEEEKE